MDAPPDPTRRRLTLGDCMGLVAASACSLVLLRTCYRLDLFHLPVIDKPGVRIMEAGGLAGGCLFLPFAVALPLLHLRDRRASGRGAFPGVGFATCVVACLAAAEPCLFFASRCVYQAQNDRPDLFGGTLDQSFRELRMQAGPAVLGAWLALALAGRWRVRPDWDDIAGALVGLGLILMFLHAKTYNVLLPFL